MSKQQPEGLKELALMGITEDIGAGDVTTNAIFNENETVSALIIAKENGVFCGSGLVEYVYSLIGPGVSVTEYKQDGSFIQKGDRVMALTGPTRTVLSGERLVLNFMQRLCGIATATRQIVALLEGTAIRILDTRKTLPGYRMLDKYAVRCGGGKNHRLGLYDMVMIKDNHIGAAGSIQKAVGKVRALYGDKYLIEVETTGTDQVKEAVQAKADIIMLDNMPDDIIKQAVGIIDGRSKIEVSGNISTGRLSALKKMKIDFISVGALTHSVTAFDLSMQFNSEE